MDCAYNHHGTRSSFVKCDIDRDKLWDGRMNYWRSEIVIHKQICRIRYILCICNAAANDSSSKDEYHGKIYGIFILDMDGVPSF